jgi:sulfoxide reductase heme-binding subunit YedZ
MNPHLWWYLARASGMVAWALAVISVLWGTALATRALGQRPSAPWLLDLHRALGGLTVAFVGLHLGALVADNYVHFGWAELFIPTASTWLPWPVTAGVVAMYFLVAVEVTSLVRRRLPKRLWRGVHLTSYLTAGLATAHAFTAGHDARNRAFVAGALLSGSLLVFFLVYRLAIDENRPVRVPAGARAPAASATTADGPAPRRRERPAPASPASDHAARPVEVRAGSVGSDPPALPAAPGEASGRDEAASDGAGDEGDVGAPDRDTGEARQSGGPVARTQRVAGPTEPAAPATAQATTVARRDQGGRRGHGASGLRETAGGTWSRGRGASGDRGRREVPPAR